MLTDEKLDDIGERLEHSPKKSLRQLAQQYLTVKTYPRHLEYLPGNSNAVWVRGWVASSLSKIQSDLYRTDTFLSLIVSKRIVLATTYYTENGEEFWEIIYIYSNCWKCPPSYIRHNSTCRSMLQATRWRTLLSIASISCVMLCFRSSNIWGRVV